jgi:hypothetical protein
MPEHVFEQTSEWDRLAELARHEIDADWRPGWSDEARAAVDQLKALLGATVGPVLAEWAVSRWIITKEPLGKCVRAEAHRV